jgi:putative hemolysin
VTGSAGEAGRYCAITGGQYAVTGLDETGGTCTLPDGSVFEAADYYNGRCPATE